MMSAVEIFLAGFASGFITGAGLVLFVLWLVRRSEAGWLEWVNQRRRSRK